MANRIPRAATKLEVTELVGSSAYQAGETYIVEKDEFGWHSQKGEQRYFHFASHLRNENFCKIKVIA